MELIKILPYLAIVSVFVRVQCTGNDIINIKHQESSLRHQECFCIPGNLRGERVSNYVSSNGEKQDRLIVYLYRDRNKKVTVYVPGKEKQKALPDLTYDDGDVVNQLYKENVNQLFSSYSEVIPQNEDVEVPNKRPDDLPYNILNIDDMQAVPDIVAVNQGTNLNKNIISDVSPSKTKQIKSEELPISISNYINIQEDTSVFPDANILKPGNAPHIIHYAPLGSDDIKVYQDKSTKDENIEAPQSTSKFIYNIPLENEDLHPDGKTLFGDITTVQSPNAPEVVNDKPNGLSANEQKLIIETQSVVKGQRPVIVQLPSKYSNVEIVPVNQVKVVSKPTSDSSMSQTPPLKQQLLNQAVNVPSNIHPKFRKWFLKQIRLIQIRRPSIRHLINVRKLEYDLVQTFYRNGMIISDSGDLRDANGNVIKMSHIRLRPIILGDPVQNEKVVANDCQTVQYFEAVLVTLIYPPKILGIIPLGKTDFSQKQYSNRPCCNKWPCYKPTLNPQSVVINKNIKSPKQTITVDRGLVMTSRPRGNSLLGTFLKSRRMDKDPGVLLPKVEDVLVPKVQTLELPKEDVLVLSEGISESEPLEKEATIEDLSIKEAKEMEVEDVEDVDDSRGDDDLGIRIVGGTPATSSGTPVSVRGRRGINKE